MAMTLADAVKEVRHKADMDNSGFISDEEIKGYIRLSYTELYDIIVSRFEDYYIKDVDFSIASPGQKYALPDDFYKARGVDLMLAEGPDSFLSLTKWNFQERDKTSSIINALNSNKQRQYRLLGQDLMIMPQSHAAGNYKLWYIPTCPKLELDTATIEGVNGWEEYVLLDAAIKCVLKEESDASALMMQKKNMLDRIEAMASNRDAGAPERVTDVNTVSRRFPWQGEW